MKHPRKHHDSRARPYPLARHRRARTSRVRSRHFQDIDPPRSTHPRPKRVARRADHSASDDRGGDYGPRSRAEQPVEGESPDYESERGDYGGHYDGGSASDSGEENTSPSHSELEQIKDLIVGSRRDQSERFLELDKRTRELAQQYVLILQKVSTLQNIIQELPQALAARFLSPLIQRTFSITQEKQDQAHHGGTGEGGTIDPMEMFGTGNEPFG
ncbi:uncharacterized protein NECHADRAFT_88488 [Fusarium vanettenii 77-13-4]|uniref:Uncharacterized protein n=1 Tax=Fusarium vanettenii (strain ATCC MYA-4622 / CBS 123669 / FGSC 9596 / NRRL 45880 / 77-13-4) TaxID=660122 RepID=C7ZBQ0_FUSV7|nr:uncharacterized protein NECHADRAFT_88488 [Fusarium vanettenii 77-13-4]EEU38603.1 predicted protein [Fusarium vanettenii 77-13-4]